MHKPFALVVALSAFLTIIFSFPAFSSVSNSGVVISQIQLGDANSARNELIEIYNNDIDDVDITNWCLYYLSSGLTQSELVCLLPENDRTHIILPGHASLLAVAAEYSAIVGDFSFSARLSGVGGYIKLVDAKNNEIDMVGWGSSVTEPRLVMPAPNGSVLARNIAESDILQDTDVYSDDFSIQLPKETYVFGLIYELEDICLNIDGIQEGIPDGYEIDVANNCSLPPVDVCLNLDGLQELIPYGYGFDEDNDCQVDVCSNFDGIQSVLPDGMEYDANNNCTPHDECSNLDGAQAAVPVDLIKRLDGTCTESTQILKITELLPNAIGDDDGSEYIEIYNPNDMDVSLSKYIFRVGLGFEKMYHFPDGAIIKAGEYLTFSDEDIGFILVNTTSAIKLESIYSETVDETAVYLNPKEGFAWALVNDTWQFTNRPTPGFVNMTSIVEVEEDDEDGSVLGSELKPCPDGQYRSSETNRCRNIATLVSTLVPCKEGQYRSEETNRCRNIVSDVAVFIPCDEGEERNPATNRCRKIVLAASTELAPCKTGQERNPETNRCRNIIAAVMPEVKYKPEETEWSSGDYILWWSLAAVGFFAISYGIWEWRSEISELFAKMTKKTGRKL